MRQRQQIFNWLFQQKVTVQCINYMNRQNEYWMIITLYAYRTFKIFDSLVLKLTYNEQI